ncbi:hypothetical protein FQN57_000281 [Myotisia sp. PD_48]|nr:hypothetical protein FQN57_000281 [Myotisia sp. PD_48]
MMSLHRLARRPIPGLFPLRSTPLRQPFQSSIHNLSRPSQQATTLPRYRYSRIFTRFNSTGPAPPPRPSFSQRMRTLSREYGWSAVGIYFFLSALDFPFCFAAVRLLGVERIGHYEHVILEKVKGVLGSWYPFGQHNSNPAEVVENPALDAGDVLVQDAGLERHVPKGEASIWTQLALAYAIHKSFIFIRVPLTAAITPKVVKTLRRWGWDIGKRKPKSG